MFTSTIHCSLFQKCSLSVAYGFPGCRLGRLCSASGFALCLFGLLALDPLRPLLRATLHMFDVDHVIAAFHLSVLWPEIFIRMAWSMPASVNLGPCLPVGPGPPMPVICPKIPPSGCSPKRHNPPSSLGVFRSFYSGTSTHIQFRSFVHCIAL